MNRVTILLLCLLALPLSSCVTTGPGGAKSAILIPTSEEVSIGDSMAKEISQKEKRLPDEVWQNYVNEIGQKIVAVCDRKDITYHFTAIQSDQINAFATPGGHIYIYTGLLNLMGNEAELAAVLAHETSHVVARHSIRQIQTAMGASMVAQLVLGKSSELTQAAAGIGMSLLFAGYSRDAEREADKYGIYYMREAGYDPDAAITMFEKLKAAGGGSGNVFENLTASHPQTQERIDNAQKEIAGMGKLPSGLRLGETKYREMKSRLPGAGKR